jgi:hypothetical protein
MTDNYNRLPGEVPASRIQLREALRSAASALKEHGPQLALAGSYALGAYGAPKPSHDVDVVVAESDTPVLLEHPREDWLFKAWAGLPGENA